MSKYQQCPGMNTNFETNTENGGPGRKASTEQVFFGTWQCVEGSFLQALVEMVSTGWPRSSDMEFRHQLLLPALPDANPARTKS